MDFSDVFLWPVTRKLVETHVIESMSYESFQGNVHKINMTQGSSHLFLILFVFLPNCTS